MNPFLILLALIAGAVVTWLLVVRKVAIEVPVLGTDASHTPADISPDAAASDLGDDPDHDLDEPTDYIGEPTQYVHAAAAATAATTVDTVEQPAATTDAEPVAAPEPDAAPEPVAEPLPPSAPALPDGGVPTGYTVKGDTKAKLYLVADDRDFDRARADIWFVDEAAALDAGFTHFERRPAEASD